MIHMTPFQSLSTLLVLILLVGAVIWTLQILGQMSAERRLPATGESAVPAAPQTVQRGRHLSLVPDLPRESSSTPYDWQVQGL